MIIGMMIIVAGWSIALLKMSPFAFIVLFLSKQELKTMVLKQSPKMGLTKTWKAGPSFLNRHVGKHDSAHNKVRQHYMAFKNQRQNLPHMIDRGTNIDQEKYKASLSLNYVGCCQIYSSARSCFSWT
jgi:hypothetical protein